LTKSAHDIAISELLNVEKDVVYKIPRYQREYTWGKSQWDKFFDDIYANDGGYFLGSIICINKSTNPLDTQQLELVDGQQRLITLSLMFAAIYSNLNKQKSSLTEDQKNKLYNLKQKLVLSGKDTIRVVPQKQNNNEEDYRAILDQACETQWQIVLPDNAGNRRIFKAYRFFQDKVSKLGQSDRKVEAIFEVIEKLNKATLVVIYVESHSDAYTLFESLNNRGTPLTAVDLIKNKLLSSLDDLDPDHEERNSEKWDYLLKYLGDDYAVRERFFRQYYNAFRKTILSEIEMKGIKGSSVATRSNLIQIYERLIERDAKNFLDEILTAGKYYSFILRPTDNKNYPMLTKPLLDLERIEGTPSYLLLLYLIEKMDPKTNQFRMEEEHLRDVVDYLVCFFVRRNLTDIPATHDLTRLFMDIIDLIEGSTGNEVVARIKRELSSRSADDDTFQKHLEGPVYSENSGVARFILCAIEDDSYPEKQPIYDLWADSKGKYIWTIEHIFPQGKNIPPAWVKMIEDGDMVNAKDLQAKHVDRLGNLTLTGYNPDLGTSSFEEKRDRKNKDSRYIGYKSELHLNDDIRDRNKWTIDDIDQRTKRIAKKALQLFSL